VSRLRNGNGIYAKSGTPVGFHDGNLIYDLHGKVRSWDQAQAVSHALMKVK